MPLYDYCCDVCEIKFEAVTPISEHANCETCGAQARRMISAPNINQPGYLSRIAKQTRRNDKSEARVSEHLKNDCGDMSLKARKYVNSKIKHSKGKKVKLDIS